MPEIQTIPTSAIPEQVNFSTPVASKPPEPEKKASFNLLSTIASTIRIGIVLVLIAGILYITAGIFNGLSSVSIESRGNPESCLHDNCISLKARYSDNTTTWVLQKDWPFKVIVKGAKFSQREANAIIRCPVEKSINNTVTKIIFLVTQSKIEDCTVGVL